MPSLTELYTQSQNKVLTTIILVAGLAIPHARPEWGNNGPGTANTASCDLFRPLPAQVVEGASIEIYAGWNGVTTIVFKGTIENVRETTATPSLQASGLARPLKLTYRSAVLTLASVDQTTAIASLFTAAGISNYLINLPAWLIGVAVPGVISYTTYGDAINIIAQVDGSPYHEMPNGQIRVEKRDPIPSSAAFRTYYSGKLSQLTAAQRLQLSEGTLPLTAIQPASITDPLLQPRLRSVSLDKKWADVKNSIIAQGAVVTATGTGGKQISQRLSETAVGPSPFIPIPPTYQEATIDAPLIDDITKLATYAIREFGLLNRLQEVGTIVVDGDPEIFYGATIFVSDEDYTGASGYYFVSGYRTAVSDQDFLTTINVTGGRSAGTTAKLAPFACFDWAVTGKVTQILPVGIGPGGKGVVVTFDGGCSKDFDGTIASYAWSDTQGNTGTGRYFQAAYDPAHVLSADVTLTVTDNDGLTNSTTKTVTVSGDDTKVGGQPTAQTFIICAAEAYAMGSADGGATWNDLSAAGLGLTGKFVSCAAQYWESGSDKGFTALFMTDKGEVMISNDACATGYVPTIRPFNDSGATYSITPIMGPSCSVWLIAPGTQGLTPTNAIFYYVLNDDKPTASNAWGIWYLSSPAGMQGVNYTQQGWMADASWPAFNKSMRSNIF